MASFKPRPIGLSKLKNTILRPATTSNFQCWFPPPRSVVEWFKKKSTALDFQYNEEMLEMLSINCIDASLPGSTFATSEIYDDYTGVTERHAYRRQYDDRSDFTFIVNNTDKNTYGVLLFFELWKQFICNENYADENSINSANYFYRMNFPDSYQAPYILINKFERDFTSKEKTNILQYRFIQAYPISINSIPVSYESTQLLQCTVSFSYTRYVIGSSKA